MNLILFGPPGVGKGTQGEKLARETGLQHLAMGDILRAAVRDGTGPGKQARSYMDAGKLVPDEVVVAMIEERIAAEQGAGFLLDGFPRNVPQARALEEDAAAARAEDRPCDIHGCTGEKPPGTPLWQTDLQGLRFWISSAVFAAPKAGVCDRCGGELYQREDDREEVIAQRLEVYREQTEPLLAYYQDKQGFHRLDAAGEMQTVYTALKQMVED